jgi:putative heme transporter
MLSREGAFALNDWAAAPVPPAENARDAGPARDAETALALADALAEAPAGTGALAEAPAGDGVQRPAAHPGRRVALAALAGGVLAVIIVVSRHTLANSLHVLGSADLGWLGAALAVEVVSLSAFGLSRKYLLAANGHPVSFRSVMAITYASNALSLSVPFAGTELSVVYSYRQFRRHGADAPTASWALAVSAIFSTSTLALLLVAGAIAGGASAATAFGFAGAAVYLVPGAGVLLALRYDRVRKLLHDVLAWLAKLSRRVFGKPENGAEGLDHFLDEVSSTHLPRPKYLEVLGLALANWVFDCAALTCAIRAMGQPVPWHSLLLVYGAGAAVGSTGITPGGFGVVELTLTAALTASGLHASKALAAVLAYRLVNFWLVLLGGWVSFAVLEHWPRRGTARQVRARAPKVRAR